MIIGRTRAVFRSSTLSQVKPVQNAFIESFNGSLREECLKD